MIDIAWNNDKNVKLVKQLMTGIGSFLRKWHNTVNPSTAYCGSLSQCMSTLEDVCKAPRTGMSSYIISQQSLLGWRAMLIKLNHVFLQAWCAHLCQWVLFHLHMHLKHFIQSTIARVGLGIVSLRSISIVWHLYRHIRHCISCSYMRSPRYYNIL